MGRWERSDHTPRASPAAMAAPSTVISFVSGRTKEEGGGRQHNTGTQHRYIHVGTCISGIQVYIGI